MKLFALGLCVFSLLIFKSITYAGRNFSSFNSCLPSAPPRTELDHFCPRIEGIHLEGCCPPIFSSAIQCEYSIPVANGQAYLAVSSYLTCENGANVSHSCCGVFRRSCVREPVTLNFRPRLLNRDASCCYENCPAADYWRQAPAYPPSITASHTLGTGEICSEITRTNDPIACPENSVDTCQPSAPCPVPDFGGGGVPDFGGGGGGGGGGVPDSGGGGVPDFGGGGGYDAPAPVDPGGS